MTARTRSCFRRKAPRAQFPAEAVEMMDRIATSAEADPTHNARVHFTETLPDATTNDAIARAAATMVRTVGASSIVCFTSSGSTARRVARERPTRAVAGADPVAEDGAAARPAVGRACGAHTRRLTASRRWSASRSGWRCATASAKRATGSSSPPACPFGVPGSTNVVHVARLIGDELERRPG